MLPQGVSPEALEAEKQRNYQLRLMRQLLVEATNSVQASHIMQQAGSQAGLAWFNEQGFCRVKLGSRKLQSRISFPDILNGRLGRCEFFKCYLEEMQNWPDSPFVAVVFDLHGDQIPDLVLHNAAALVRAPGQVLINLGEVKTINDASASLYLQTWKGFCAELAKDMELGTYE